MRVAGRDGVDLRGNTSTSFKHFAPRLGIAYQANSKTVVRLGYGRSFDIGVFGSIFGHAITQNLPVLGAQQLNANTGAFVFNLSAGPTPFDPASKLANNCNAITDPTGTLTQCLGVNGRPLVPDGVFSRARPFNNRLPTVDQWNVTVQRQVTSSISATLAYVGNKGTHTFAGGGPAYGANEPTVVGYNPNGGGLSHNERRPYFALYGWTQGIDYFGNDADNHYNSLQATVEKRFASGLSFNANYTFSTPITTTATIKQHTTEKSPRMVPTMIIGTTCSSLPSIRSAVWQGQEVCQQHGPSGRFAGRRLVYKQRDGHWQWLAVHPRPQ
jgi:hypothetical protein